MEYTTLIIDDVAYRTQPNRMYVNRKGYKPHNPSMVVSFMPGNIQDIFVKPGDEVTAGAKLCILEAMKMKNVIIAPIDGRVKTIHAIIGERVSKNHLLIELE